MCNRYTISTLEWTDCQQPWAFFQKVSITQNSKVHRACHLVWTLNFFSFVLEIDYCVEDTFGTQLFIYAVFCLPHVAYAVISKRSKVFVEELKSYGTLFGWKLLLINQQIRLTYQLFEISIFNWFF